MINNFLYEDIISTNDLLHNLLGYGFIELKIGDKNILVPSERILLLDQTKEDTGAEIKKLSGDDFNRLVAILLFYLPRRVAGWSILQLENSKYRNSNYGHAADNELLTSLTSIIDWLANIEFLTSGYTKRLKNFLKNNLDVAELNELTNKFNKCLIIQKNGQPKKLENIDEFSDYIYEIRSEVAHNAQLSGMYRDGLYFEENDKGNIIPTHMIFPPGEVRKYLWKAIFNNLGLTLKFK